MKFSMTYTLLLIGILQLSLEMNGQSFIQVDQFGYHLEADKVAVINNPIQGYNSAQSFSPSNDLEVRLSNSDEVVFSGPVTVWSNGDTHDQSGDQGWWFDFSEVTLEGKYYINDPQNNERSADFEVSDNPYAEILRIAGRAFYYNRCGTDKPAIYAEANWADGENFNQDKMTRYILDQSNTSLEKDMSGGWFDAGDYNKYVTFTYGALHNLLRAFELNRDAFTDDWNIPESGNGVPDILDEIKWELDWLFKMANTDGSVHIKMGSRNHGENVSSPPSANEDTRYYGPICSSASATLASVFAHASIVFSDQQGFESYAMQLEEMAVACFDYVLPLYNNDNLDFACDDGSIVSGDADVDTLGQLERLLSASVYLYELTENELYLTFFNDNYIQTEEIINGFWSPYKIPLEDAMLKYTTLDGRSASISSIILQSAANAVSNNWNGFYLWNELDLYRGFMPDWSYHWGSNQPKAHYGNLNYLMSEYGLGDEMSLRKKGNELLHYFHGVNPQGLVYLSNMYEFGAEKSVNEIYHIWFADGTDYDHALNSPLGPAPGFLTGGPNADFTVTTLAPPAGQPLQKSFLDFNDGFPLNSWEITEPGIYYQAAYIRLLAAQVSGATSTSVPHMRIADDNVSLHPNPAEDYFRLTGDMTSYSIEVIDQLGNTVMQLDNIEPEHEIDISSLGQGIYFIKVEHQLNALLHVQLMIKAQ